VDKARRPGGRAAAPPRARAFGSFALIAFVCVGGGPAATAEPIEQRVAVCLGCHGARGQSAIPETPSLGGQPAFFVVAQLFLFREGRRQSEAMTAAARGLTNDDLRAFAGYIAKLPAPPPTDDPPDPAAYARGQALARKKPCGVCHNPDFSGREQMPRLAGQREDYLLKAMREYRSGARIGYGGATMGEELAGMSDGDLRDLAHFLARASRPAP